jgi:DNA-binding PadR family transcriptional regulator
MSDKPTPAQLAQLDQDIASLTEKGLIQSERDKDGEIRLSLTDEGNSYIDEDLIAPWDHLSTKELALMALSLEQSLEADHFGPDETFQLTDEGRQDIEDLIKDIGFVVSWRERNES